MPKTFELQTDTSTPSGATLRLTVEYRSKILELVFANKKKEKEKFLRQKLLIEYYTAYTYVI